MERQPRLFLTSTVERAVDSLVVGAARRGVTGRILTPGETWPRGGLLILGPPAAGKSHLLRAFLEVHEGRRLYAGEPFSAVDVESWRPLAIDDADQVRDEAGLFRLLERAQEGGGKLLLTASRPPRDWGLSMRDLVSRLESLPRAVLADPDPELLVGLLTRLCRQRFMKLDDNAADYLARHMDRTYLEAHRVVEAIDALVTRGARPVSALIAARALKLINPSATSALEEWGDA